MLIRAEKASVHCMQRAWPVVYSITRSKLSLRSSGLLTIGGEEEEEEEEEEDGGE